MQITKIDSLQNIAKDNVVEKKDDVKSLNIKNEEKYKERSYFEEKDKEKVKEEIENINKITDLFNIDRKLDFELRDKEIIVKVTDSDNNVIRQVPAEKILEFRAKFKEVLGLFVDQEY